MCLTVHSPPWVRILSARIISSCPGNVSSVVASFQVCLRGHGQRLRCLFSAGSCPRLPVVFAKRCERFRSPSSPVLLDDVTQPCSTVKQIGFRRADVCGYLVMASLCGRDVIQRSYSRCSGVRGSGSSMFEETYISGMSFMKYCLCYDRL